MKNLELINDYLDEIGIENNIEYLPNAKSVLTFEYGSKMSEWWITVEEVNENGKQIRLYSILSNFSKEKREEVYQILNNFNKKYDYVKFFCQESEQGDFVFASHCIPSLDSGIEYYFVKILKEFVIVLDDAFFNFSLVLQELIFYTLSDKMPLIRKQERRIST